MRLVYLSALLAAAHVLAGCSGERGMTCESVDRYAGARSVAPVRVPDDLSVPDESEAIRVPFPRPDASATPTTGCLELPPDFFEGGVGSQRQPAGG
jgi:uncharacterized lipoprotein